MDKKKIILSIVLFVLFVAGAILYQREPASWRTSGPSAEKPASSLAANPVSSSPVGPHDQVLMGTPFTGIGEEKILDVTNDQFCVMKYLNESRYDVVAAGDSRTMVGVAPQVMEKEFKDKRIFNFGFRACIFTEDYLNALEAMIDPASSHKTIVLGVDPLEFVDANADFNGFTLIKKMTRMDRLQTLKLGKALGIFNTAAVVGGERRDIHYVYYSNGWAAAMRPESDKVFDLYRKRYPDRRSNKIIMENLLRHVAGWTKESITVYGYRTPTTKEMEDLEKELFDFSEEDFVREFTRSGGIWLTLPEARYHCNDSNHMDPSSALAFSQVLAQAIRRVSR